MGAQPGEAPDRAGAGSRARLPLAAGLLRAQPGVSHRLPQRLSAAGFSYAVRFVAAFADSAHPPALPQPVFAALSAGATGSARTGAAGLSAGDFHPAGGRGAGAGAGGSVFGADGFQPDARTEPGRGAVSPASPARRLPVFVSGWRGVKSARRGP